MSLIHYSHIEDPVFRDAVKAVDEGDIQLLNELLNNHPGLINAQTYFPGAGYFEKPYLFYFVADNPIRNEKLPENILDVIRVLIKKLKESGSSREQEQLDYTLGLIGTGSIPRASGKQIAMMDLLLDAGAIPGDGIGVLAHGNLEAARHLIKVGAKFTLTAAVCFNEMNNVKRLFKDATNEEKFTALTAAAFYGFDEIVSFFLSQGVNPNGYPAGFLQHATPLHQAVNSGNLSSVKLLIAAGANVNAVDKAYNGTPLGWSKYMQEEEAPTEADKKKYHMIEAYLSKV